MTTNPVVSNHQNYQSSPHDTLVKKLEATIAELQQENTTLKQQVKDDEIELAATVDEYTRVQQELTEAQEKAERSRIEAERANEVKSAFLASMSHELRTPLNAIMNYTKFVAKGDLGPINEQQVETLNRVTKSSRHLLNLINDVLDMSKIESGSLTLFVQDGVDISAILGSTISTAEALLNEKPVELHTDIDPNLPGIRADRQRILQVLLNVISNACKFTDEGSVNVAAHQSNGEILITVEDTGTGIAADDQAGVFEPFKQTSSGLRKGGGTGLGMPIAKNLVEVHGGRLWLESEVDKGSTFFVTIPIQAEHLTPTIVEGGKHD